MGTNSNQLQRYMSRGTCVALLPVLAFFLLAAAANVSAQPAQSIVVSQLTWDGGFTAGGAFAGDTPAGNSWGVNADGVYVASDTYGGSILQFNGAGYPATVAGPYANAGAVAIDSNNFLYISGQYSNAIAKIPMGTTGTYSWTVDPSGSSASTLPACTGVVKTDTAAGECLISNPGTQLGYFGVSALGFDKSNNLYFVTNDQGSVPFSLYQCTKGTKAANECIYGAAAPTQLYEASVTPSGSVTCTAPAVGQVYLGGFGFDPWGDLFFTASNMCNSGNQAAISSTLNELTYDASTSTFSATPTVLETLTDATPGNYDDKIVAVYSDPATGTVFFGAVNSGIYGLSNAAGLVNTGSLYAITNQGTKLLHEDAYDNLDIIGYNGTTSADTFAYIALNGPSFPGTAVTADILVADNTEPCTPTLTLAFTNSEFAAVPTGTCGSSSIQVGSTAGVAAFDAYTITLTPVVGVPPTGNLTVTDTTSSASSTTISKGGIVSGVDQSTWGQPFLCGGVFGSANSGGTSGGINSTGGVVLGCSYGSEVQEFSSGGTVAAEVGPFSNVASAYIDSQNYLYVAASYNQNIVKIPMATNGTYPYPSAFSSAANPGSGTVTGLSACTGDGTTVDTAGMCLLSVSTETAQPFGGGGALVVDAAGDLFFATDNAGSSASGDLAENENIFLCNVACLYNSSSPTYQQPVLLFAEPPANTTTGNELLVGGIALDSADNLYFTDVMVSGTGSEYNLYTDVYELPVSSASPTGYAATPTLLETLTIPCDSAPCNYNNEIDGVSTDSQNDVYFADQYTGIYELTSSGTAGSFTNVGDPTPIAAPGAKVIVPDGKGNFYFAGYNSGDTIGFDLVGQVSIGGYATAAAPTTATGVWTLDNFGCDTAPTLDYAFADTTDTWTGTEGATENLSFGGGCAVDGTVSFAPAASTSGTVTTDMTVDDTVNGGTISNIQVTATAATVQPVVLTGISSPVTYTPGATFTLGVTGNSSGNTPTFAIDTTVTNSAGASLTGDDLTYTSAGQFGIDITVAGGTVAGVTYAPFSEEVTITVSPAPQTIAYSGPTSVPYSTATVNLANSTTGGAGGQPVTFTFASGPAGAGVTSAGVLTLGGVGTIVVDANQAASTNGDYAAALEDVITITVTAAAQTISFTSPAGTTAAAPQAITFGGSSTLAATGGASGNGVTFTLDASSTTGAGSLNGSILTATGLGTIVVDANQAGNTDYTAATQVQAFFSVTPLGIVANPAISPTSGNTLSVGNSNDSVSITDSTANAVIWYTTDGSTPVPGQGTAQLYTAAFTLPNAGTVTVNAVAIEAGYTPSAVATATFTVVTTAPAFTMMSSTTTATVTSSETATATLTITPVGGFDSAITFSCTPSATIQVSCAFNPTSATPTGDDSTVPDTVTISKGTGNAALQKGPNPFLPGGVTFAALALCFLGWKKRRGLLLVLLLVLGTIAITQVTACGGPTKKTGTLTVTATGGGTTQTVTITVTTK